MPYLVMQPIDGEGLDERLAREGRPSDAYDMTAITAAERRALPQAPYSLMYAYPPIFQMVMKPLATAMWPT